MQVGSIDVDPDEAHHFHRLGMEHIESLRGNANDVHVDPSVGDIYVCVFIVRVVVAWSDMPIGDVVQLRDDGYQWSGRLLLIVLCIYDRSTRGYQLSTTLKDMQLHLFYIDLHQ